MLLLKSLMIRNCADQFLPSNKEERVPVPFTVCALQESTEYEVLISDTKNSMKINSELTPTFFNDNHVLSSIGLLPK